MGYLLITLSVITALAESTLIKLYNSRSDRGGFLFTALVSLCSMLFFVFRNTDGFSCPSGMWGYAVLSGILYSSASLLTYKALQYGSFAISMLILSYAFVFPMCYGIFFLGDQLSAVKWLGLILIILSVFLSRGDTSRESSTVSVKWLVCLFASVVGSGLFAVVKRVQQIAFDKVCDNEFMIVTLAISAVVLFILGLFTDGITSLSPRGVIFAAGAGVANGITNFLGFIINTLVMFSLISPLTNGIKLFLSYLISRFVYKETFLPRQTLGMVLGLLSVILLTV